jgi:hypothetical protein
MLSRWSGVFFPSTLQLRASSPIGLAAVSCALHHYPGRDHIRLAPRASQRDGNILGRVRWAVRDAQLSSREIHDDGEDRLQAFALGIPRVFPATNRIGTIVAVPKDGASFVLRQTAVPLVKKAHDPRQAGIAVRKHDLAKIAHPNEAGAAEMVGVADHIAFRQENVEIAWHCFDVERATAILRDQEIRGGGNAASPNRLDRVAKVA